MRVITVSREEFEATIRDAKRKPDVKVEVLSDYKLIETVAGYSWTVQTMQSKRAEQFEQLTLCDWIDF